MSQIVPDEREIKDALVAAAEVEHRIPTGFAPRPASVAEQVWMSLHAQHRGLSIDKPVPDGDSQEGIAEVPATRLPTAMPTPWLDEGGQSDLADTKVKKFLPFNRRYLKVPVVVLGRAFLPGDAGRRRRGPRMAGGSRELNGSPALNSSTWTSTGLSD